MAFIFDIIYPTPESRDDTQSAAQIAQQDVLIRRADPQPGDADLEIASFRADQAEFDRLKALPGPVDGLPLNQVQLVKIGPTELRATLYYSNNGFFGLGIIDPTTGNGQTGAFDAQTRERMFDIYLRINESRPVGGGQSTADYQRFEIVQNPTAITVWQIRVNHPTYNINDVQNIAGQQGAFHLIGGNVYKFMGATSVRRISTDPLEFQYTYEWEIDPGVAEREIDEDSPLSNPDTYVKVFPDPIMPLTIANRTFSGRWWRPPFTRLLPKTTPFTPPGGIPTVIRDVDIFWDGSLDQGAGWINLPGDPVNSL